MAKGSLNGVRKGKKGDSVYYTITGSNSKEKQGERQYIGEVANPKTMQQAAQRMKLTPAVNFYRALGNDILNHSFQGIKYGARNHAEFMKLAMNNNAGVFPFVPKGYAKLVPGRYVVSRGSLAAPSYEIATNAIRDGLIVSPQLEDDLTDTVEEWMSRTIWWSKGLLQAGDQITLVWIWHKPITQGTDARVSDCFALTHRIILDPSKDGVGFATAADWLASKGLEINGNIIFPLYDSELSSYKLDGAAIIISRPSVSKTNGAVTWLRSNSSMVVSYDVLEQYFSQAAYDEAIRTYLPENVNPTSGWYLNDGTLNPDAAQIPVAPGLVSYVRSQRVTLREQSSFGKYGIFAVDKNLRKQGIIATPLEPGSNQYARFQLYSFVNDASSEEAGTVIFRPAGFELVAANENEMADVLAFLGDYITPDEAITAMAEEGVTITKGY